jgi:chromosomal replication initiation ATPase DnaA
MLVSYYGEDGRAIDSNWFAKLEPQVNDVERSFVLKAPSEFIKEWVQSKYSTLIEKFAQGQNYNLIGVSC